MIDLQKFAEETTAIVPILGNAFQYKRKKYILVAPKEDGWYKVSMKGNTAKVVSPVMLDLDSDFTRQLSEDNVSLLKGFTYNDNFIPQNFDVAKRKAGIEVMTHLELNTIATFSSIEAVIWENKKLLYYRPNFSDSMIYQIKMACEEDVDMTSLKFLTPELKTVYLFHNIERQKIRAEQERILKEKELEEFRSTLQGRLILSFTRVGAKILNYHIVRNRITVDWEIPGSGWQFNSVIEADTFRVVEAGYCMSGHDREHSVHSMVELAKIYEEEGLIHKTRE
jgi:hypothetical protein